MEEPVKSLLGLLAEIKCERASTDYCNNKGGGIDVIKFLSVTRKNKVTSYTSTWTDFEIIRISKLN